jgi:MinD superfamily P-loop ATPase
MMDQNYMIKLNDDYCPKNHSCPMVSMCHKGAITQIDTNLPNINKEKCDDCGDCYSLCRAFEKTIIHP